MRDKNEKLVVENGDLSLTTLKKVYDTSFSLSMAQQKRRAITAKRLVEIRKRHKLTQKELCDKIGVLITTYSGYENGKHDIPTEAIVRICELLDISADYVLGITENPKGRFADKAEQAENKKEPTIEERMAQLDRMMKELKKEVSQQ